MPPAKAQADTIAQVELDLPAAGLVLDGILLRHRDRCEERRLGSHVIRHWRLTGQSLLPELEGADRNPCLPAEGLLGEPAVGLLVDPGLPLRGRIARVTSLRHGN